ncbi:leucine-rich repeat-containing protein 19-like [Centroberyx affinis]|uniref:leucine-rich repeat-containing protein 19-like n=1 Tax=Centroberyx affinis TaxID=166261 RepID=UPI003A5C3E72
MVAMSILDYTTKAAAEDESVVNLTNRALQVIPHNGDRPCVMLVMEGNLIILNETDRLALATYPGLAELHLDSNLVTVIPAKYFSVVPNLRVLHLSRNNISSLDPEAFSGLDDLVELDLSHNLLMTLPIQLFRQLNNLKVLDLRGNSLEVLDSNTTDVLGHLRSLDLQENPWNCSCLLLHSIGELNASGVAIAGPGALCASPEKQAGGGLLEATAICYPSPPPPSSTAKPALLTSPGPVSTQQPRGLPGMSRATLMSSQNHSISNKETQAPVLGNTWTFTLCVAAVALSTSVVIVCAIKGPTWHKLLSSYRHRRLREEDNEEEEEEVVPGVFLAARIYAKHRLDAQQPETFAYGQENGRAEKEEEEEDGYIEDLYIERADYHAGGGKGYSSAATEEEA